MQTFLKSSPAAVVIGTALLAIGGLTTAQTASSFTATPTVVIVRVAKPWYAPQALVAGKMRDTMAQYSAIDGLLFKAYSFERNSGDYGGVYYWQSTAAAKAWFSPAWFERVRKERGTEGRVRFFEAPVSIDNTPGGTLVEAKSSTVATLVEINIPAGVGREALIAEFNKAVPTYQKVPGLLRKQFILSDQGTFGGVYIWRDQASAASWFNTEWQANVQKKYGSPARMEWFDTPILQPTQKQSTVIAQP